MLQTERATLYKIYPVESGETRNGNKWANQRIVVEIPTNFNSFRRLALKVPQKHLEAVARVNQGDRVQIQYVVESREWNDRWITEAVLLYIHPDIPEQPQPQPQPQQVAPRSAGVFPPGCVPRQSPKAKFDENGDSADLPF
jgi:hypothetical protein